MDALHLNPLRYVQIYMSKIPYPPDAVTDKLLCHFLCTALGYGQDCDVDLHILDKLLHLLHRPHRDTVDLRAANLRVDIEDSPEDKPSALKVPVIDKRLPEMPRPDDDQVVLLVKPQYPADLLIKILHIVAISLLAETAEIVQILSDLGRCHLHDIAQFLGGNSLDPLILQFTQIPEIPGQTADHSL